MAGFIEEVDRGQQSLLPGSLDDWVHKDNPVRVIDAFVEALNLHDLGFETVDPIGIGRPGYHPSVHLKLYIYGYLHRIQSSRRLERECARNLEVMWLLGRLAPDFKAAQADDLRCQIGRPLRQAGLRVSGGGECLSLPGG